MFLQDGKNYPGAPAAGGARSQVEVPTMPSAVSFHFFWKRLHRFGRRTTEHTIDGYLHSARVEYRWAACRAGFGRDRWLFASI
jgi:hypothetical protein